MKIKEIGQKKREILEKETNPSLDLFFSCAKQFAKETGLLPSDLEQVLRMLEKNGFENCSMVMLGKTICCFSDEKSVPQVQNIIRSCDSPKIQLFTTKIDCLGARKIDLEKHQR